MRRGIFLALGLAMALPAALDAQRRPLGFRGQALGPGDALGVRAGPMQAGRQGMAFHPQLLIQRREALSLSEEQVTRLEELAAELRGSHEALPATIREHEDALREAWRAETTDVDAIQLHTRAILDARQQAALAAVTATARARALLTAEQRARVEGWVEGRLGRAGRGGMRRGTGRRMPGDARPF